MVICEVDAINGEVPVLSSEDMYIQWFTCLRIHDNFTLTLNARNRMKIYTP